MRVREFLKETSFGEDCSRRDMLTKAAKGAILVAAATALPGCAGSGDAVGSNGGGGGGGGGGGNQAAIDVAVLQFALNLEYLEAEFYTWATKGHGIEQEGVAITGNVGVAGPTTGGVMTNFTDLRLRDIANETAFDERQHVLIERGALGGSVVRKPAIKLDALGDFSSQAVFLAVARAFEDTGVSAYAGAAKLLSPGVLDVAARILATEAYHAGVLRLEVTEHGVASPATDGKDVPPPPTGTKFYALDGQGLAIKRTPREVLDIVYAGKNTSKGGFFPAGANLSPASAPLLGLG